MKLENWSPGYAIIKPFVKLVHRLMYRKMVIVGKENIKSGKPLILAPNHQNALLDSLAVLFASPFQPVWLARADIFSSKMARIALNFMKMTPVYRIRDGKESLGKNEAVFQQAVRILENNHQLALFPEATHTGRRQAVAHKKAVPRIAFTAGELTNFEIDVQIVPVGIYYSHYYEFDRDALIVFGKPIALKKYKIPYEENPTEASQKLKKELNEKVLAISFNIPSKKYYEEYEQLRSIIGRQQRNTNRQLKANLQEAIVADQKIVDVIYAKEQQEDATFQTLLSKLNSYQSLLRELRLSDKAMAAKPITSVCIFLRFLDLLLRSPFAFVGYFAHYLLYAFPLKKIKTKIKDHAFWGSVLFVIGLAGGIILYGLYALIIFFISKSLWITLGTLVVLPLTAKIAWRTARAWTILKRRVKIKKALKNSDSKVSKASALRQEILIIYTGMSN